MNTTSTTVTEKNVASFEARRHFGELIDGVKAGDKFVIEEHGKPVAAVIPLEIYNQWKKDRDEAFADLFAFMNEASDNAGIATDEEAMRIALEAVAAVRAEEAKKQTA